MPILLANAPVSQMGSVQPVPSLSLSVCAPHHLSCRMRYVEDVAGNVSADIAPAEHFTVPLAVSSQEQADIQDAAAALAAAARQPFNLSEGCLLRAHLLFTGPQSSMLALVVHHAVVDAWSWVSAVGFGCKTTSWYATLMVHHCAMSAVACKWTG